MACGYESAQTKMKYMTKPLSPILLLAQLGIAI